MALTAAQKKLLKEIIAPGREIKDPKVRRVYERAAAQTAIVESGISNPSGGDADSEGWRQERRSFYDNPTNVKASAKRFKDEFLQHYTPGEKSYQVAAEVQRPREDLRGRYHDEAKAAKAALRQVKGGGNQTAGDAPSGTRTRSVTTSTPGVDNSEQRRALQLAYLQQRGKPGALLSLAYGLNDAQDVPGETTTRTVRVKTAGGDRTPRVDATSGYGGKVIVDPGANRAGADMTPEIKKVLKQLSARAKKPVEVGTGTNHSQMTTSGNVSDHWSGNAGDVPLTGAQLTRRFKQALLTYGKGQTIQFIGNNGTRDVKITRKTAAELAKEGGIANISYDGRRVQAIGNTTKGGNHYDHLHVGVSA